jgi:transposase
MIEKSVEAQVLRFFYAEKWRIGTIATHLGLHHSTVSRVLDRAGVIRDQTSRGSILDPYADFIADALSRYPKLTATRLHRMIQERGFKGGVDHFRHQLRQLRLRQAKPKEPFLRLKTLIGEEGQVDWAHFGRLKIGRADRQLMAFVMVLSHSRRLFVHFFLGQSTTNFLRGHVIAFQELNGCPRLILYDNLKSAVIDRRGDAIHFNPDLLALSAHYHFEPRPCAPYRGNEKGRVERSIRYLRSAFFEGLEWTSLDELNEKVRAFCTGPAMERKWREDPNLTVKQAFEIEQKALLVLPAQPFPAFDRVFVTPDKTAFVRFDLNDYSVPHDRIGRTLTLVATLKTVRILDGVEVLAQHRRSFDKGAVVEDQRHRDAIRRIKRRGRQGQSLDRLSRAVPESVELLRGQAERGHNIGSATLALIRMLDLYGREALRFGVKEAIERGVFHPHAVRHAIEKRRGALGQGPVLPLLLNDDPRISNITVIPHDLSNYDLEMNDAKRDEGEDEAGAVEALT